MRKLLVLLEDKRAICGPYDFWNGPSFEHYQTSVLEIRREITSCIQDLPEESRVIPVLRAMRAACRKFLSHPVVQHYSEMVRNDQVYAVIGEFRGVFGIYLAQLCSMYGIDLEEAFVTILPAEDEKTSEVIELTQKAFIDWYRSRWRMGPKDFFEQTRAIPPLEEKAQPDTAADADKPRR